MKKITIAQIGSGHDHAEGIFPTLKKLPDVFEIKGYYIPESEKVDFAHKLHHFTDYPELTLEQILEDPEIEAVTIETEEVNLCKYALLAAKAGKHMHMDKPGGLSVAEFAELVSVMREKNLVLHLGYMYRYNPEIIRLLEQVRNGELGQIYSVEAQMNCYHPKNKRQWLDRFPGGMMFYLGCHLIDLILQIKGMPERIVPMNRCTGIEGVTAQDYGMAILEYPDGVSFAKTCATEMGGYNRRQLVVSGSKGTVEMRPLEWYGENGLNTDVRFFDSEGWDCAGDFHRSPDFDRYEAMMSGFAKIVRGEYTNPWSLEYELDLYRIVMMCCGVEL